MHNHFGILIGGQWVETGRTLDVVEKFSGRHLATVSRSGPGHVRDAVDAAWRAFADQPPEASQRAQMLHRTAQLLRGQQHEVAISLASEVGKPLREARNEVERGVETLLHCASVARLHADASLTAQGAAYHGPYPVTVTMRVPLGVVAVVTPFCSPLATLCTQVGPALAAGNPVIIKPASYTPLSAVRLSKLLHEAGFPPGFVNLVVGSGRTLGRHLLSDQRVAFYSFAGSAAVAAVVGKETGMRRHAFDLGGAGVAIVLRDADLNHAAQRCARAAFANAGQGKGAVQRIYVDREVLEAFRELLLEATQSLGVGDPLDDTTDVGVMVSMEEADRVAVWIDEARRKGASVLTGAKRRGKVVQPTILLHVNEDTRIAQGEVSGPVVTLEPFVSPSSVYDRINAMPVFATASVFTSSRDQATNAIQRLRAATVEINDALSEVRATASSELPENLLGPGLPTSQNDLTQRRQITIH